MLNDSVILTLFLGLGIFGTPTFIFSLWLMWRELRDTQDLADYYHEQWRSLGEARREAARSDWLTPW